MYRILLILFVLLPFATATAAGDPAYASELIDKARALKLSSDRQWLNLVHYNKRHFGMGYESLVVSANFFTAPDGKFNPEAELEATLREFFSDQQETDKVQNPQCRFVARYHWLKERLDFDPARLPEQPCPRFEKWVAAINPAQVTLIFPSAYMNNPSSMFGHTLIRIDMPQQDERTRIISYAINFAAVTDESNGVAFAIRGLTGGYPGQFSIMPYYEKVREYSDLENRDIWEYQLNFTPEEIQRMLQHAWEMGPSWFRYYFFDENCSYQLLTLLDVARPGMNLADQFPYYAIPSDTVHATLQQKGLLKQAVFRPSSRTKLNYRLSLMDNRERALTLQLAEGTLDSHDKSLAELPAPHQALVMETAQGYVQYRLHRGDMERDLAAQRALGLLRARAELPPLDVDTDPPVPTTRPDQGHQSARFAIGGGRSNGEEFSSLQLRPSYHDLMDPQEGFLEGSQINFLDMEARYYHSLAKWQLERFTLVDIASLSPRDAFFKPLSWTVAGGLERAPFAPPGEAPSGYFRGGAGLSYRFSTTVQSYMLLGGSLHIGHTTVDKPLYTASPQLGLYWSPASRWRTHLRLTANRFFSGEERTTIEKLVEQRYTVAQDLAVKLVYRDPGEPQHANREGSVMLQWYF